MQKCGYIRILLLGPYHPCMEYLPALIPIKINYMNVSKYTVRPMDPMGGVLFYVFIRCLFLFELSRDF